MPGSMDAIKGLWRHHLPLSTYRASRRLWHLARRKPGDARGEYLAVLEGLAPLTGTCDRPIVNLTVDFELAWNCVPGIVNQQRILRKSQARIIAEGQAARRSFHTFLDSCNRFAVPVTFSCVGHLFLERCSVDADGVSHSKWPRFQPAWWPHSDWLCQDPATDLQTDPLWYAPDLIRRILDSSTPHEIGCHTFSHVDFSDPACSPEIATAEIDAFYEAASKFGVERCSTFIFPNNRPGHRGIIARKGFRVYRDPALTGGGWVDEHGLLAVPRHLHLNPAVLSARDLQRALDLTVRRSAFLHINLHLCEFSCSQRQVRNFLRPILKHMDDLRRGHQIEILTLGEVADLALNRRNHDRL